MVLICALSHFSVMLAKDLVLTERKIIIRWINFKYLNPKSQLGNEC